MKEKNNNIPEKEYILTYKSEEHFEVLGWVKASSMSEAKTKAQQELLKEAKFYEVAEAEIAEWENPEIIPFNIS